RRVGRPDRLRRDRGEDRESCGSAEGDRHMRRGPRRGRGTASRRAARRAAKPVLLRRLMRIAGVETRRYVFPFEPPLRVAWDPVPRTQQEATIVIVRTDDGLEGYASGDALPDRELLERLLVGVDP